MPDDWEIKKSRQNARAPSLPKIVWNSIIYHPFLQNCSSNIKASHEKRIKKGKQWRRNHPPIWNNHTHRPSVMLCWLFPSDSSMLLRTCLLSVTYWELSMLSLPAHVHMLLLSMSPCLYLTPMLWFTIILACWHLQRQSITAAWFCSCSNIKRPYFPIPVRLDLLNLRHNHTQAP